MPSPLVSVITPTWQRPEWLVECLATVKNQTYHNIEHIVVSDGPDSKAEEIVRQECARRFMAGNLPEVRYAECGFNTTSLFRDSFAVGPLMVGTLLARGEYQMWLADDEKLDSRHVEWLLGLIQEKQVDFVYPMVYVWSGQAPEEGGYVIGCEPPRFGRITSVLYRRELLDKAMHRFHMPRAHPGEIVPDDWDMISRWLEAGATHAMLNRVTVSHRADHK